MCGAFIKDFFGRIFDHEAHVKGPGINGGHPLREGEGEDFWATPKGAEGKLGEAFRKTDGGQFFAFVKEAYAEVGNAIWEGDFC